MLPDVHALLVSVVWMGILLPVYSYVVFPALIVICAYLKARLFRSPSRASVMALDVPDVAVVVAAYNEERDIDKLLVSFRSLSYAGRLRLYVGSDGSTDKTAAILNGAKLDNEMVFAYPTNRGKAAVLNDLLSIVQEPLVVLTDANTRLAPDAVTRLAQHFSDSCVGVVCGELSFTQAGTGDNADGSYWRFEQAIKRAEAEFGALLGANGGIYAIRRSCFKPIKPRTIIDDFCIGMSIAAAGYKIVYEPRARAYEEAPSRMQDEFGRRVRIGIGNYQAFFRHPEYLIGSGLVRGCVYFSHKVLRWFTPHLFAMSLLANATLLSNQAFRWSFIVAASGLLALGCGYLLSRYVSVPRLLRIPVMFVGLNVAFLLGFLKYLTGNYAGGWLRSARS